MGEFYVLRWRKLPTSKEPRAILNFIWLGSALPPAVESAVGAWRDRYGASNIRIWSDADLVEFAGSEANRTDLPFAQRSDILRLEILRRFGGWYLDCDYQPGPAELVSEFGECVLVPQDATSFQNQAIYGVPGSAFLERAYRRVLAGLAYERAVPITHATGPWALTDAVYAGIETDGFRVAEPAALIHVPGIVGSMSFRRRDGRVAGYHIGAGSWSGTGASERRPMRGRALGWHTRTLLLEQGIQQMKYLKRLTVKRLVKMGEGDATFIGEMPIFRIDGWPENDPMLLRLLADVGGTAVLATGSSEVAHRAQQIGRLGGIVVFGHEITVTAGWQMWRGGDQISVLLRRAPFELARSSRATSIRLRRQTS